MHRLFKIVLEVEKRLSTEKRAIWDELMEEWNEEEAEGGTACS
jgi:hypothetical protein